VNSAKVALSMPGEVLRWAKKEVAAGRAKSLSSFVSDAVDEKLRRDELSAILDVMDLEHGKPNKAQAAWAKRVLRRRSS
jgi:Arc/MetJ-type ribon-helix-helix transcriptional regulator